MTKKEVKKNITMTKFGLKIREIRQSMKLTQLQFAERLGWEHPQSINQIESGRIPFPADRVLGLCRLAPQISVDEIVDDLAIMQREKIIEKVYSVYASAE